MRDNQSFAAATVLLLSFFQTAPALAANHKKPLSTSRQIRFDTPALAPMAYMRFCLRHAAECSSGSVMFRGGPVKETAQRWTDLNEVNEAVNNAILPERNEAGLANESWQLSPVRGDCNDYAVTKRHQLLKRGWPPRAVLLSEVVTRSNEHHLVVVVRMGSNDLVLDNMTSQIRAWNKAPYQWRRIQKPGSPRLWASIAKETT